jgi:magnesium chelatase subunit D
MRLSEFVGHEEARLGLLLNAVDPHCGGLLLVGGRGCGKSTLARLYPGIIPADIPFIELPLNATEDSLLGGVDLERTLASGSRSLQPGILSRAHGGTIFVDDINLLSPELTALLMEPRDRGVELIEREGISEQRECRFTILATMNPEEGYLSPHLADRFGLCAIMEDLTSSEDRLEVLRAAMKTVCSTIESDDLTAGRVIDARKLLPSVKFSPESLDRIAEVVEQAAVQGHRAELFLYYAARACAALEGAARVGATHVDRTAGLVVAHRRMLPGQENHPSVESEQPRENDRENDSDERQGRPDSGRSESLQESQRQEQGETGSSSWESSDREEVQPVGTPFAVRRIALRKDRMKRRASGRRTTTRSDGRGGRYVKSLLRSAERDVAVDATLRACAPFQQVRGRQERLIIKQDDLRFKQRERKTGHLVLFVVDGSGSMGAQRRMTAVKGAIHSLLLDCYRKRDKVAMIVFRKDLAELVLPPTASVELAAKRLALLPVGGKTPLSAGLLEAHRLAQRTFRNRPDTRILLVLLTDGRGNHSLTGKPPVEEGLRMARLLREEPRCDSIVVDTENKGNLLRANLAKHLATELGAGYFTIESLQAEHLADLVRDF